MIFNEKNYNIQINNHTFSGIIFATQNILLQNMTNINKISIPFFIGYLLMIVGAVLRIIDNKYSVFVFGAGVVINLIFRFLLLPRADDKRIRRLNNQQFFVAVFLILTCYLMWLDKSFWIMKSIWIGKNTWVITLIISAVIDLWLTFRYPEIDTSNQTQDTRY